MLKLNLESNEFNESKKIIVPKEIIKLIKDYEQSKWLTGC
jgi:hypothetical protein